MKLAYTMAPGRGDTDLILAGLARDVAALGLRCCGTVQTNTARDDGAGSGHCDMDVQVLPDGPVLRISQDLGPSARGCRLDPAALETAVSLVAAALETGADLMIINKLGKHEAEGRGFRDVIAEAVAMDIPVLVGLNDLSRSDFEVFAGGLAVQVPPEAESLQDWVKSAIAPQPEPA